MRKVKVVLGYVGVVLTAEMMVPEDFDSPHGKVQLRNLLEGNPRVHAIEFLPEAMMSELTKRSS
jgi:hypothetical protein